MTTFSPFPPARRRPPPAVARRQQAGVALAVALVILVVITLIGVTAIRRAQLQSRLSQNAEATVMARSTASVNSQAMVNRANAAKLLSLTEGNSYDVCWMPDAGTRRLPDNLNFTCAKPSASAALVSFATALPGTEQPYSYFRVRRDTPATLPTSTLRGASMSGVAYKFANFSVLSGYDASGASEGVAEVSQGVLQPTADPPGLTQMTPRPS